MHESRVYILTFIPLAHSVRILIDNYETLTYVPHQSASLWGSDFTTHRTLLSAFSRNCLMLSQSSEFRFSWLISECPGSTQPLIVIISEAAHDFKRLLQEISSLCYLLSHGIITIFRLILSLDYIEDYIIQIKICQALFFLL